MSTPKICSSPTKVAATLHATITAATSSQSARRRSTSGADNGEQPVLGELRRGHGMLERLRAQRDPEHERGERDPDPERGPQRREPDAHTLVDRGHRDGDDSEIRELEPEVRRPERHAYAELVVDVEEDQRHGDRQHDRPRSDAGAGDGARPPRQGFRHGHGRSLGSRLPRMELS